METTILTSTLLSSNEMDTDLCTLDRHLGLQEKEVLKVKFDLQQVILNNRESTKNVSLLTTENDMTCYDMEVEANHINQYSRRSNIEIRGIPENIHQRVLEKHLIDVLHSIGIDVD